MAYCKYCGKELGEDNKCTCAEFQDNEKTAEIFTRSLEPAPDKPIKRGGAAKYLIAALILLLIMILVIFIISASGSYKKPIKDLTKGIRQAKSELIIDSIYTEATAAELRLKAKENGLTWKDYLKQNDKNIDSAIDGLGVKYLKADILAKERLSGSNFEAIEKFYDNTYSIDAKKAYRVEVEFTFRSNGEKQTRTGWLCVVKLKGEGWKFCPQHSADSFDFIDYAIKLE